MLARNIRLYLLWRTFRSGFLFLPIFMLYILSFDISYTFAMSLPIVTGLTQLLLEMPSGVMSDLLGRRRTLLIGSALYMLNFLFYYLAEGPAMLVASGIAFGAALAFFSGTDSAFLYDSLKGLGREHEFKGVEGRAFGLQMGAMAVGALIGGPVADVWGMRAVLLIMVIVSGANALVTLLFTEPPRFRAEPRFFAHLGSSLRFAARHPRVRFLSLFGGTMMALMVAGHRLLQPGLQDAGVTLAWFGPIYAAWLLTCALAAFNAKRIEARVGVHATLVGIPLLLLLGYVPLAFSTAGIILLAIPLEFAFGYQKPAIETYLNTHLDSQRRATILSISGFIMSVALFIIGPLAGLAADLGGLTWGFGVLALLSLGGLLWTVQRAPSIAQ